jgi:hypothetical protein
MLYSRRSWNDHVRAAGRFLSQMVHSSESYHSARADVSVLNSPQIARLSTRPFAERLFDGVPVIFNFRHEAPRP